jgi:hypothetical protein
MRGKLRVLRGRFDYRGFESSCTKAMLWNDYKKSPKTFQLGSRVTSKNVQYEHWLIAQNCTEYDSMDG